jgi:hypothetical protein
LYSKTSRFDGPSGLLLLVPALENSKLMIGADYRHAKIRLSIDFNRFLKTQGKSSLLRRPRRRFSTAPAARRPRLPLDQNAAAWTGGLPLA